MPSKYLNIFMTYSESVGNKKDYFVCFLLPFAEEKLSSRSNVQVYWSLVMSCPCDWDVANSEEKTRNGYSSLLLNTTHTHTHTNTCGPLLLLQCLLCTNNINKPIIIVFDFHHLFIF
ncbi:hypothetical protein AMECASPLE_023952 [Ameca splendens]|uniref:Uncharacterized protein n=1 Tax=Ameca splendens TaxID=208324 RepID=A0ABV0ZDU4_9TELE